MALSDGLPHPIPTTALVAAFDPPTYLQQHSLSNANNNNGVSIDLHHFQQHYSNSNYNSNNNHFINNNNNNNNNNNHPAATTTNTIAAIISPEDEQQLPCEQYKEFLDASHHERVDMIDNLVDVSVDIIDSIWPTPSHAKVVATKGFIREILKRSKTTYFMLQISLFYIFRVKRVVQAKLRMPPTERHYRDDLMCCGRRMFLASLMVASKYIHDKSYRNKAWADASGLTLAEINASELAFLQMIDYRLYVSKPTFEKWYGVLNQRLKQRKQQQLSASMTMQQQQRHARYQQQQQHHPHHHPYQTNASIKKPVNVLTNPAPFVTTATATTATKATMTTTPAISCAVDARLATTKMDSSTIITDTDNSSTPTLSNHKPLVSLSPTTRSSAAATTHYPSPASPCFYHPDFNDVST